MAGADERSNRELSATERNEALLDAAAGGDTARVVALLDAGADVAHANEWGFDALGSALWESHMDTARVLVERGAPVGIDDAAALGDLDAVDARFDAATPTEETIGAYLGACRSGQVEVIDWFLRNGVPVDLHPPGEEWGGIGCPGLHHAVVNGHSDVVRRLLGAGADVTLVDDVHGSHALAWAASAGHADIVRLLLEAGAEPGHRNVHGRSASGLALDNGFSEIAAAIDHAG
jgi:ankyrin repeat protein